MAAAPASMGVGAAAAPAAAALAAQPGLAATPASPASAVGVSAGSGAARDPRPGEPITLNFVNAEIDAVARTLATLSGRQVVVDPRVKGVLNLATDRAVAPAVAWNQFLALLRLQGYAVVESAGLYKVVPEADAKLQGGAVSEATPRGGAAGPAGQIATQIFALRHESANNLVAVLRPLISPNNTINVSPGSNALVITDYTDNLQRLARIIAALDVSNASDVEVIPLRNTIATDLVPLLQRLLEPGSASAGAGQGQADTSYKTTLLAEPRSNTVVLRAANAARVALVRALIDKLDQPGAPGLATGNIHVIYLKNADAVKLASTLRAALGSGAGSANASPGAVSAATPGSPAAGAGASSASVSNNAVSTGGQVQADASTNSLIITAPEPQYRQLRAVIDQLDVRRAQVYVESLIAEVNADRAAEFGIQWQGALGQKGDGVIGLLGTNFGKDGANLLNLTTGANTPTKGLNIGLAPKTNGVYALGFLARFLESTGEGNILSTPNLLTLDNEEAKIIIGQNVPFVTGQYTNNNAGSGGTVNPFQTIERKDVGLTLKVKPQISENGTVRLSIFQETSSVLASSVNSVNGPTTNKRSFESNVLVSDGSIVVLGGLLQDEYAGNQDKVPVMGDIPLLGHLFRTESRSRKKTNLMVFLRPVVVRDAQSTETLSLDRYELMRAGQIGLQPAPSRVLGIQDSVIVPPIVPRHTAPSGGAPASR